MSKLQQKEKRQGNNQLNHYDMKEFPTCRFLTTAFSQSKEDNAPADLREQFNEFLTEAQQFVTIEDSGLFTGTKVRRLSRAYFLISEKELTGRKRPLIPARREISEYGQARHPYTIPLVLEFWLYWCLCPKKRTALCISPLRRVWLTVLLFFFSYICPTGVPVAFLKPVERTEQ